MQLLGCGVEVGRRESVVVCKRRLVVGLINAEQLVRREICHLKPLLSAKDIEVKRPRRPGIELDARPRPLAPQIVGEALGLFGHSPPPGFLSSTSPVFRAMIM